MSEMLNNGTPDTCALAVSHIDRYFPLGNGDRYHAIRDVSLEIPAGKLVILKGRSGSGKTTLLNMLSTLDAPDNGSIAFFGQELGALSVDEKEQLRRYQMGFVFQSIALIPVMSAYENVDFVLRLADSSEDHDARIREVIGRVGLTKRMNNMAGQLSGGEQQRIAIARAVAHHPRIIFADEPTGALDTASGLAVMQLFKELVEKEKVTIVMTTHDPNLMEMGDLVFEIEDGQIQRSTDSKKQAEGDKL